MKCSYLLLSSDLFGFLISFSYIRLSKYLQSNWRYYVIQTNFLLYLLGTDFQLYLIWMNICSFQSHVRYFFHVNNLIFYCVDIKLHTNAINNVANCIIMIIFITISTTWFNFLVPILKWLTFLRCLTHLNEYVYIGNLF